MPKYVNHFRPQEYLEETILDEDSKVVGTIRLKPSSILWKPKSAREYYSVSIDTFHDWITQTATGAKKVSK